MQHIARIIPRQSRVIINTHIIIIKSQELEDVKFPIHQTNKKQTKQTPKGTTTKTMNTNIDQFSKDLDKASAQLHGNLPGTGLNILDLPNLVAQGKTKFEQLLNNAKGLPALLRIEINKISDQIELDTTAVNQMVSDENGNTYAGAKAKVDAAYEPKINKLTKSVATLEEKAGTLSERIKTVTDKLFGEEDMIPKKSWVSTLLLILAELGIMIFVVMAEMSINEAVFYAFGYTPEVCRFYAIIMSIVLTAVMFFTGYFIKIGIWHPKPLKTHRILAVIGGLIIVGLVFFTYFLVKYRNDTMTELQGFDSNPRFYFMFMLSTIYYMLGILPPIFFAAPIPFWEQTRIDGLQKQLDAINVKIEADTNALNLTKQEYKEKMAEMETKFKSGPNGLEAEEVVTKRLAIKQLEGQKEAKETELREVENWLPGYKQNVEKKFQDYVKDATSRFESDHSTDTTFLSIKNATHTLNSIVVLIMMAMSFMLSSCGSNTKSDVSRTEVVVVLDKTDMGVGYENTFPDGYLLKLSGVDVTSPNPTREATVVFTLFTDVDINQQTSVSLNFDDANNPQIRKRRIKPFITVLDSVTKAIVKPTRGEPNSLIFGPLVRAVNQFSNKADHKKLILCSDMLENKPGISFLNGSVLSQPDSIIRTQLETAYNVKMPSLQGIDIIIVYDQQGGKVVPALANKAGEFWIRWFKKAGAATAEYKANLGGYVCRVGHV